jgi:arylsulfatase A
MMRTVLLGMVAVFALHSNSFAAAPNNVVLVMLDDFGYECVGANGGTSYQTPHLDALAREGARGTRFHAQPLCTPTRVQLMTGQSNVRNYTHFGHLDPAQRTFAHLFRLAGYRTAIAGKWQLGRDMALPQHFGFDQFCLWQLDRRPPRYANAGLEVDGKRVDLKGGVYGPDFVNDYARNFIMQHKDQPFLLYYPMILTHGPFQPTPDSQDWDPATADERSQNHPKHFADMVTYADKLIGRLLETIDQQGLAERTLVIVIGDNGTGRGITSRMGERVVEGGKGLRIHTGTHVPFLARWPGTIPPGTVLENVCDTTDLLPTICAAAAVPVPTDAVLDGRNLLGELTGKSQQGRDWIYCWYARSGGPQPDFEFALDKRFKLYRDGALFDVTSDPEEQQPLDVSSLRGEAAASHAKLTAALAKYAGARPAAIAAQGEPKRNRNAED